jgi:hypothetical protein
MSRVAFEILRNRRFSPRALRQQRRPLHDVIFRTGIGSAVFAPDVPATAASASGAASQSALDSTAAVVPCDIFWRGMAALQGTARWTRS